MDSSISRAASRADLDKRRVWAKLSAPECMYAYIYTCPCTRLNLSPSLRMNIPEPVDDHKNASQGQFEDESESAGQIKSRVNDKVT